MTEKYITLYWSKECPNNIFLDAEERTTEEHTAENIKFKYIEWISVEVASSKMLNLITKYDLKKYENYLSMK